MSERPTVIVGAAAAGVACAEALRRGGHAGRIVMVDADVDAPHDRPPLSKQVLAGEWEPARARLLSPDRMEGLEAEFLLGRTAVGLDPDERILKLDDGSSHAFEDIVIATGVRPRRLPGDGLRGVHVLRGLGDAIALREAILAASSLVVVGAGFLGLEVAATAARLGASVTVVEPAAEPLGGRLGTHIADRLTALHLAEGVDLRCGVGVSGFESTAAGRVSAVVREDGESMDADVVLVAIGCEPEVDWLGSSGLPMGDGLLADERLRVADRIWAAGDVCNWDHRELGRRLRIEHRTNASEQGRAVALAILGSTTPFTPVPFFWTEQYDVRIQMVGFAPPDAAASLVEGELDGDSFAIDFAVDGKTVGVVGWNAPRAVMQAKANFSWH